MPILRKPKRLGVSPAYLRSPAQEKSLAKTLGGERVPGSGSGVVKGDIRIHRVARIEAKTTSGDSFRVTKETVAKIENAAMGAGELPALVVEFLGPDGKPVSSVAVVPMWVLDYLVQPQKPDDQ